MAHHNAAALAELEAAIDAGVDETSPAAAELIGQLARAHLLVGRDGEAVRWGRRALEIARRNGMGAIAVDALVTVGTGASALATKRRHRRPAGRHRRGAGEGLQTAELPRATTSPGWRWWTTTPHTSRSHARAASWRSRIGMLDWAVQMAELGCLAAIETGDWDWALATHARFEEQPISAAYRIDLAGSIATIQLLRGAERSAGGDRCARPARPGDRPQDAAALDHARAWRELLAGNHEEAAGLAETSSAWRLGRSASARVTLRARAERGQVPRTSCRVALDDLDALHVAGRAAAAARATLAAGLAALDGPEGCRGAEYAEAAAAWRALDLPLNLALCLLEWRRFADGDTLAELRGVIGGLGRAASSHSSTRWR